MNTRIKVLGLIILAVCISFSVYADVSLGVGAGSTVFLTTRIQMDRITSAVVNVGIGDWNEKGLYIRPQIQFEQHHRNFRIDRAFFYPYLGVAVPAVIKPDLDLSASGVLGMSYYVANGPVEIFLELLPHFNILREGIFRFGLGAGASIGARYTL